jgi:5-methylcytosine-specific restriction enzyme subunit McrC
MKPVYQITEYGSFITGKKVDGYITLPPHTFEQLESFILTNRSKDADALELMGLSARKGIGKVITARNYVGIITMNDGTTIEILPKVSSSSEDDSAAGVKRLLIEMLKTLRDSPYKNLQSTSVNVEKMNIFDVFIRMFIDEVFFIVKVTVIDVLQCTH